MHKPRSLVAGFVAAATMTAVSCSPQDGSNIHQPTQVAAWTEKDFSLYFKTVRKDVAAATPALFARARKMGPPVLVQIPQCGTPPPTSRVVKLRIADGFDVKDTGRDVFVKNRAGGGRKDVPEPMLNVNSSTTYDLNLDTSVWAGSTSQYIAISIYLKDDYLTFINDDYSVMAVDTQGMFYCLEKIKSISDKDDGDVEDDKPSSTAHNWNVATFYVDGTMKGTQKFDIWLIARHKKHNPNDFPYVLPVILDPIMDNNGYN